MKKLKLTLQQLEGAEVLIRSQLKQIFGGDGGSGGGSCCSHNASWDSYTCGLSKGMAQDNAPAFGYWCCDSCGSSYFKARNEFMA